MTLILERLWTRRRVMQLVEEPQLTGVVSTNHFKVHEFNLGPGTSRIDELSWDFSSAMA